jgi:hypothetical protein
MIENTTHACPMFVVVVQLSHWLLLISVGLLSQAYEHERFYDDCGFCLGSQDINAQCVEMIAHAA